MSNGTSVEAVEAQYKLGRAKQSRKARGKGMLLACKKKTQKVDKVHYFVKSNQYSDHRAGRLAVYYYSSFIHRLREMQEYEVAGP